MGRPPKKELDYFPLVCGFFQDEKIIALRREHGALGIATYIFLLTKVYGNGYYLKISNLESFAQTIAENLSSSREPTAKVATHVVKIIRYMAEIDLLSKQHLNMNCITSVRIQEQYAKSKERYGGLALIKAFSLISEDNSFPIVLEDKTAISVTETPVSVTETQVNATEMPQSKVNKSKVNNIPPNACAFVGNEFSEKLNAFCDKWGIAIDTNSPLLADFDFDKLDKAYSESETFLQDGKKHPCAKSLDWIVRNYLAIIGNKKYKDKEGDNRKPGNAPPDGKDNPYGEIIL